MSERPDVRGKPPGVDEFFSSIKQVYDTNEKQLTQLWEQVLTSEPYANWFGVSQRQNSLLQDWLKRVSAGMLNSSNLPSREDLANLANQVISTEEKVDELTFRFDDLRDQLSVNLAGEISSLRAQVSEVQYSLNLLIKSIERQGKAGSETSKRSNSRSVKKTAVESQGE